MQHIISSIIIVSLLSLPATASAKSNTASAKSNTTDIQSTTASIQSTTANITQNRDKKHIFDGGMMFHTGYLSGDISPLDYHASGMPFGIGGVLHYHISNHFRIGGEGYVSTLRQMGNGSYIKYGWGGILGDFRWPFEKFAPYAGLTLGGGANTDLLIMESPTSEWKPAGETYFRHRGFFFIDPFIGCDYALTKVIQLTLKVDYMTPIGNDLQMPLGPRIYFGILFYH